MSVYSQGVYDIITMSQTQHGGTARFASMGGAFTALGGDASTLSQNPAGVGTFRRTDISITPFIPIGAVSSKYMGIKTNDDKASFGLSNASIVFNFDVNKGALKYINFGIAYNNQASFLEQSNVRGGTTPYSRLDAFAHDAYYNHDYDSRGNIIIDNRSQEGRNAGLAYENYLINDVYKGTDSIMFYPAIPLQDGKVRSSERSKTRGSIGEYAFSLGANIEDMLYLGITFGIQNINYSYINQYSEFAASNNFANEDFSQYTLHTEYSYNGVGYNFKGGFIIRPFAKADFLTGLRLGGSAHTSTFTYMNDYDYTEMNYQLQNGNSDNKKFDPYETKFEVQTPYRLMAGAAYVFGNQYSVVKGTLSFDYEYSNYSSVEFFHNSDLNNELRLNSDLNNELRLNSELKKSLKKGTSNYRVGGELVFQNVALRAGYALYDTPHLSDKQYRANVYSGGIGFSSNMVYFDIGYSLTCKNTSVDYYEKYGIGLIDYDEFGAQLIPPSIEERSVNYRIFQHKIMITIGMRF